MVANQEDVEIVISGIGGYFPQSKNVEELQKMLLEHTNGVDVARWEGTMDVCDSAGTVPESNHYDSYFFATGRRLAVYMDPMTRMTLQNTLEAILDAGMAPAAFRGRRVLVAAASCISDTALQMYGKVENGLPSTGQARAMLANRISYWLHSRGPSYVCDASWLGGMQVLQHGYDAIRTGNCEAAIVCAANYALKINPTYLFKNLGVISPDGVTNTFGENAEGYARSDATCVFVLQRADQARRRYCTLVNVDSFFNGHRPGQFIRIDIDPARRFLQNFYQKCGVAPTQVSFVETYGSAVKELDKIELNLIDDVFNNGNRESQLLIGAVKTNIGHTEASNAFTSIVKTIIAFECGTIPANLQNENPRTDVPALTEGRLKIVTKNTPWNGTYAAVNTFGIASAFGHVLLKRNPIEKIPLAIESPIQLPLLHIISTRSEDGIKDIIECVKTFEDNIDYTNLINGAFATHIPGYLYRGYVVKTRDNTFKDESAHYSGITKPVWFIYSGMGSQWLGMGKALLELPIFARAVEKCANALKPFDVDLMNIITGNDETLFDNILNSFVGIAAIQIGLTDVLFSLGITPVGIVGHSVGELGCAYADGCLTAEQMILSAYYRGRASLEAELIPGLMAAVGVGATAAAKFVPPSIDIACHNGPSSCTLSGPKEDMEKMVKQLQAKGTFAQLVNVAGIAYHSRYIKPIAPLLLNYLHSVISNPKERSSKWLSSSVPEARWHTDLAQTVSAEYLTNNLLSPVYFEEALRHIPKGSVLIEIAPHGLLQAILKRSVHRDSVNVALTRRGHENGLEFLFTAIGKLYVSGVQLDLTSLYEDIHPRNIIAPKGTPSIAPLVRWIHNEELQTDLDELEDSRSCEQIFSLDFHSDWFRDITNHRIHNSPIIPATEYLSLVREIVNNFKKVNAIEINDFSVQKNRLLGRNEDTPIRIMVHRYSGMFEVSDQYGSIATGRASVPKALELKELVKKMSEDNRNEKLLGDELFTLTGDEIYRELAMRGLELNGIYRAITDVRVYRNGLEATILWKNNFASFATSIFHAHILHPSIPVDFLLPGYIRHIFFNFENIPEEGTPIPVRYTRPLDSIWSPIMLMKNIKCSPTLGVARRTLRATASRFIPEEIDENIGVVVDACLQENICITDEDFSKEKQQNDKQNIAIKINNVHVKYIGVHSSTVIPVETNEGITPKLGLVDYCGTKRGTNTRVMGVCNANLIPDPIFQWNLPAKWSFVDGATAPASYALAYYALVELASLNARETVFIHNACSALGQAMIHVAFSLKAKILATVANDRQKGLLLQHMKMLNNETVFYYTNCNFEQKVMDVTKGQGVDVLINFTKGERLRASARCIRALGRAVLLQDEIDPNVPINTEILGLGTFLRCVGMYGVFPARLCNWDEDKKRRIHQLVQQGLDNSVIMPIRRNIFKDNQPIENVVRYVTGPEVTGCAILPVQQENIPYSHTSVYQCDSNKPYVLYGLNSDVEHSILISIWLANHNAKKIILVVAPKNNSEKLFVERQLRNLNITVDLRDNLPATRKLKNIAAIIFLPNSKNISPTLIPTNTRLVNFLGINSSTLSTNPFRSTLRQAKTTRFEDVLPFLSYALSQTVHLTIHGDDENQTVEEDFTFKDFFRLLGESVPSLLTVKTEAVDTVTVDKVSSAGTGEIREMPPLFVVPGLLGTSCRYLQQTIMKIMCPVYVINAQQRSQSVEDIAGAAVQRICELCPKGPYNIAGVSTGGIIALEIARLLDEKAGRNNVQLYLLDGIPATFQYLINETQTSSQGFDSVLIQYLLQINQPEILNEILSKNKTWQSRLRAALNLFNLTHSEGQQMTQTINILRKRLELIQKYSVSEELLNVPTKLLRPSVCTKDFSNTLFKICKKFRLEVFKGNHFTMLQSQAVADYINDNIVTPPIYC